MFIMLLGIALFTGIILSIIIRLLNRKSVKSLSEQAKIRADLRSFNRAWADTESIEDPWNASVNLQLAINSTEIFNDKDMQPDEIANAILAGYKPPTRSYNNNPNVDIWIETSRNNKC